MTDYKILIGCVVLVWLVLCVLLWAIVHGGKNESTDEVFDES